MKTRIAPTPSGYIHIGNAFNFKLIQEFAIKHGHELHLRIDDFDKDRVRVLYIEDIFEALEWLKIKTSHGPKDKTDFYKNYSIQLKQKKYWEIAQKLYDEGHAYACDCSRSQKDKFSETGAYLGHCRKRGLKHAEGTTALRLKCPENFAHSWQQTLNDFVIWTKENFAAYQLVSTIEDIESEITTIVRGNDLMDSSSAQQYLSLFLGENKKKLYQRIQFYHHKLILNPKNPDKKYSKSEGAHSLKKQIQSGYNYSDFIADYEKFKTECAPGII